MKAVIEESDGAYSIPQLTISDRYEWLMMYHYHSTSIGDDNLYAGPSGTIHSIPIGDLGATLRTKRDGVVFTRLDDGTFNADYYGVYPVYEDGHFVKWEEFVVDLGAYDIDGPTRHSQ